MTKIQHRFTFTRHYWENVVSRIFLLSIYSACLSVKHTASLSLCSVCSVVPLYLSAFVRANVLKWREIKAGKPCVSHTNSSPCGPIGLQHAYWWRHIVPRLRCTFTPLRGTSSLYTVTCMKYTCRTERERRPEFIEVLIHMNKYAHTNTPVCS